MIKHCLCVFISFLTIATTLHDLTRELFPLFCCILFCSYIFDKTPALLSVILCSIFNIYLLQFSLVSIAIVPIYLITFYIASKIKKNKLERQLFLSILEEEGYSAIELNQDGKIITWNEGAKKAFLYKAAEVLGSQPHKLFTGDDVRNNLPDNILNETKKRRTWSGNNWYIRKDTSRFWGNTLIIYTGAGFKYFIRDITKQRQDEIGLERWRRIFYHGGWAVVIIDNNRNIITHANTAFAQMHNTTTEELINKPYSIVLAPEFIPETPNPLQCEIDKDYTYNAVHMKKNGQRFPVLVNMSIFEDDDMPIYRVAIIQDMTEQKRMERDLRVATERKTKFIATVAHEIKNPLHPIKTTLHICKETGIINRDMIDLMDRNVKLIEKHIEDLLDTVRIVQDKTQLQKTILDINDVISSAIEQSYPYIKNKNQKLYKDVPLDSVFIEGDFFRLQQVFTNILINSSKYTNEDGSIWIKVETDSNYITVKIADNGIGISREMLSKIFDLYVQTDIERSGGGLGLGLTIAAKIVHLHKGEIYALSDGLEKGSTFVVKLAIYKIPVETPNVRKNKCKILIVDDNIDAASTMEMLFVMEGFETFIAHDGIEAIEMFSKVNPDVVVLDIGLPKLSGWEVAKRIRLENSKVILIAVTGYGFDTDREKSKEIGFNSHVVKPVNPQNFKALIKELVDNA